MKCRLIPRVFSFWPESVLRCCVPPGLAGWIRERAARGLAGLVGTLRLVVGGGGSAVGLVFVLAGEAYARTVAFRANRQQHQICENQSHFSWEAMSKSDAAMEAAVADDWEEQTEASALLMV